MRSCRRASKQSRTTWAWWWMSGSLPLTMVSFPSCNLEEQWKLTILEQADEEKDYEHIRRTYLPDLILDYHNVLYYASYSLDKPGLLSQCMTVSIWIATIPHLTRSFTEAKRMGELMEALALASKAMVLTDPAHDRMNDRGQTLGIWRVSAPKEDESGVLEHGR